MLVLQKNKTINWQISWASLLSCFSLEGSISIPVCLCWLLSGKKKKLIKKRVNSLLPFKFSHEQWFPRALDFSICCGQFTAKVEHRHTSSCKTSSTRGKGGQTLHDKRRCHSCSQKQQTKNKPRKAQLNLQQCRDAAEVIWHLCSLFLSLSFIFLLLPLEAPSQQGVVSVETMDSRFSPQRNRYYGNLT